MNPILSTPYPLWGGGGQFKRIILTPSDQLIDRLVEFEKYFKAESVDLFIVHDHWKISPFSQILLCKFGGIKNIIQFHGYLTHYVSDFRKVFAYRLADGLVTLTNMSKEFWKNFGLRTEFIPHPTIIEGAENFHGRNPKKCSSTILYVGRVTKKEDKNTFAVLPILNEVVKFISNVKLKILGDIYSEEVFVQMKNFIAENHLEGNVEFCGYQTNVRPFYEEADVILSTSPSEGWPLFVVESKFYELPLVLYELPDVETLSDGKGHIAVPQGDFISAAQAIVAILTDTELRCKLSAEARESLQKFIDYDVAGAWRKLFTDIKNNAPIPPHNINNEKLQTFFLNEIWQAQEKIYKLQEKFSIL